MAQRSSFTSNYKRSSSLSPIPVQVKRHKSERSSCAPYDAPLPLTATHGVEQIKYAPGIRISALTQAGIEKLVRERRQLLFTQRRRVIGLPLVLVYDSDADLSQTPADNDSDSDIEIISFKLATDHEETRNEHTKESFHMSTRFSSQLPAHSNISVKGDEASDYMAVSRSSTVPSMNRDQAMAELCGEWSSVLESGDSMVPDSDDDRLNQPADINEVTKASSSRSEVRTSPARTFGASRGQEPTSQCDKRPSKTSTAMGRRGVSPRPSERSDYPTSDRDTTTDDGSESDVSLQPRRLRQVISLSSESRASGSDQDIGLSTLPMKRVPLPKTPYGRSRRLLVPDSDNLPLAAITMRADVQFIDRRERFRLTLKSLPNPGIYRHVEDACTAGNTVVLGYNIGPSQVTFVPITTEAPYRVDARASPHVNSPWMPKSSGEGVRCLAPMRAESGSVEFFSGGHDRRIFKWAADARSLEEPIVTKLNVFLDSGVSSMAYRHHNNSLVSTDTKKIYITDLTRSYTPKPRLVSNDVHQIHVHPQTPDMTLLEVRCSVNLQIWTSICFAGPTS
ncbi:hypothetical protein AZE42_00872 [Rhizopogon vesiculosus]|uniref:Uncharacterized protein n=1 Tax=Rhizopogon vesiculosus TaxID=180088 RepID=A0A1J8R5I1_9AGAM|nr:hypothetical protein AZE42_00872 [Rhizopogon vesiculosus]